MPKRGRFAFHHRLAVLGALALSACGGGGGSATPPDTPEPTQPDERAFVRGLDCTAPDSAGWCWQQPQPGAVAMADAHFTDADHGWAVGEAGTVLRTDDGGRSWSKRFVGTEGPLRAVRFADARTGWILGEQGSWYTLDGGSRWTRTPAAPQASLGRVWVQPDGRVLVSPDVGASSFRTLTFTATPQQPQWQPVPMWVSLVTQPGGAASTWHGVIVDAQGGPQRRWGRSTDNGGRFVAQTQVDNGQWLLGIGPRDVGPALWAQVAEPLLDPVSFDLVGWRRNQLVLSGDDGATWGGALDLPTDTLRSVTALRTDGRGAARPWAPDLLGRPQPTDTIEVTADGGRSWAVPRTPDGSAERALSDAQWLLQAVAGSRPWLSSDFGASWTGIDTLPATPARLLGREPGTLMFASAVLPGGASQIHRSTDRGRSWTRTPYADADPAPVTALWFHDASNGVAVQPGAPSRLYETTDGGRSWSARAAAPLPGPSMHFTPDGTGWGVGIGQLLRSTDRGRSWTVQPAPGRFERPLVERVRFLDARFGWALAGNLVCATRACFVVGLTLFATEDGGATWAARFEPQSPAELFDVAYLSPTVALRLDRDRVLHRSADGGRTWARVGTSALPATLQTRAQLLAASATLAFIADDDRLWRSTDAGQSWQLAALPAAALEGGALDRSSLYTPDARRLFVTTGARDLLLTSTDGGANWTAQRTGTGLPLHTVFALDERRIWLGAARGAILATASGGR